MTRIALCIDEMTCQHPELIGLEGEALDSQKWLSLFSSGGEARKGISGAGTESESGFGADEFSEVWVVSCEDVEPINLAASIKSDEPDLRVCLVTTEVCGSLLSRAHTALIDEVLDQASFPRRYADAKRWLCGPGQVADGVRPCSEGETHAAGGLAGEVGFAVHGSADGAGLATVPAAAVSTVLEVMPEVGPSSASSSAPQFAPQSAPQFAPMPESALEATILPLAQALLAHAPAQPAMRAFVLPVVSGSGGAGKSAVSALGALAAHRMGHHTLLLDYDLQFGDVAQMVGVNEPLRLDMALAHPDQLERELARDDRLAVLAAPARLEAAESVVRGLPELLDRLSGSFDVIVANTGAAWAEQHAALLERSSAALFLIDQRASSVQACRHALELCARCGIATGPFQFALNRCAKGAPLTSMDVSCALQGDAVFELKDGGRDVEDYLSSGSAADLFEMKNEFAKSVEYVMRRLLPGGAHAGGQPAPELERRGLRRRGRHADRKRGRR